MKLNVEELKFLDFTMEFLKRRWDSDQRSLEIIKTISDKIQKELAQQDMNKKLFGIKSESKYSFFKDLKG